MAEHDPDEAGVFRIQADQQDGGRATVALVLAEIRGLRDLTDARFTDVQRQLGAQAELPARLQKLGERFVALEARVQTIEDSDAMQQSANEKRREFRAGTLPMIAMGLVGTIINVALFVGAHH